MPLNHRGHVAEGPQAEVIKRVMKACVQAQVQEQVLRRQHPYVHTGHCRRAGSLPHVIHLQAERPVRLHDVPMKFYPVAVR